MSRSMHKLAIAAAVAAALMGGLTACKKTSTTEQLIAEAKLSEQKGERNSALIQLKNAATQNPGDAEVRMLLGQLYFDTGDMLSAEKEVRKAASLGAKPERVLPLLAKILLALGKPLKALEETDAIAGAASPELNATRGIAYLNSDQPAKAKAAFEATLSVQPANVDALLGMARHVFSDNDPAAANRYVDEAVSKNPKSATALLFKAAAMRAQDKPELALAAYDQALAIDPENRLAHIEKAQIRIGARQFDEARREIAAAKKLTPNSVAVLFTQAMLDLAENKPALALESLMKVLRVVPDHLPSLLLAGMAEVATGANQQAEQHLKKYLEGDANNYAARQTYVRLLLKLNRAPEAAVALAPLLKETDNAQAMALAGQVYLQMNDFPKASTYFEKASTLAPKSSGVRTGLGMSKLGLGETDSAVRELALSTKLDATAVQPAIMLALTELKRGRFDQAMMALTELEKAEPDNATVHTLKGSILLGKREVARATASFEKALAVQPTHFPATLNLVQLALQDKKPDLAKQRLEAFLAKNPKHAFAMRELAALAQATGHGDEATTWLERAHGDNPDAVEPGLVLVRHYLQLGQKEKALPIIRKFQTVNPANADVLEVLGLVQLAHNDNAAALETYSKLVNVTPKSGTAHYQLGLVHMALNNEDAAAEDFKKAAALVPDFFNAEMALGQLALRKRNYDQALQIGRQMQKSKALAAGGAVLAGDALMGQKKPQLAYEEYQKSFAMAKNAPLLIKMHNALQVAGQQKQADALLAQWLQSQPNDLLVPTHVAEINLNKQQYKVAIGQFEAILKRQPKNAVAWNNLAFAYQKENDVRALHAAEEANRLAPGQPALMDTLGWVLVERGDTKRGVPILQKAVALAPGVPDFRLHLGAGLIKAGDKEAGKKELEQVIAAGADLPSAEEARVLLRQP